MTRYQRLMALVCVGWGWLYAAAPAIAQDDELRLGQRTRAFLEAIAAGESDTALEELLVRSPLAKDEQRVTQLKQGLERGLQRYGKFLRVEGLRVERIGRSLMRCVYLYHCEEYPVVWTLVYYRPTEEGTWNLVSLKFDVDFDSLPATP